MANLSRVVLLLVVFLGGCDLIDPESTNSRLASLAVSSGTLEPAFSADLTSYSVTVDAATDVITISATAEHGEANVAINGGDGPRGSASANVSLEIGSNSISVVVSAEDRKKQTTYTVSVTRLTPIYSIGGTVSGLTGDVTLQNNGADDLTVSADGAFTFATSLDDGSNYDVTVAAQPAGQECTVASGSGMLAGADVSDVSVTCVDLSFTVGGTLTGLNDTITLQNNGGDDLDLTADGAFTFTTPVDNGAGYDVTISSQPTDQECTVSNGTGTVSGADVTNVAVNCDAIPVKFVGGVVSGLVGTVTLELNSSSDLLVVRNGTFNFSDQFNGGEDYDVQVVTQPNNQTCSVSNNTGTIGAGYVLDVRVDCTGAGVATGSIFDWDWINPLPQGNGITAFATDGTQIVAVGWAGLVRTSTDGLNWTTRDAGTGSDLYAIAWGDGKFVALSLTGAVLTSPDGVTWQSQETGFKTFTTLIWTGSQFVAAGSGFLSGTRFGAMVGTSPDGSTWSYQLVDQDQTFLQDIAWNGNVLAAVQFPNIVHTSSDGIAWTTTQIGDASNYLRHVASDGTGFMMTANDGVIYTSPDGDTWTQETETLPFSGNSELEWDGSRFVALGTSQFSVSADGSTWTTNDIATAQVAGIQGLSSFIRHSGQNIIGHNSGAISTSPDDTSWTTTHTSAYLGLFDVIWNDNQFIAVGDGPRIITSPDGTNWTDRYSVTPFRSTASSIVWGGGQYVVVGAGNAEQILTSPDGVTWTPQTPTTDFLALQRVAYGNDQFLAIGQNSIITSPDGTTWTDRSSSFGGTEYFSDVAWNGSTWVITGYRFSGGTLIGYIWTSPDGIDWTEQLLNVANESTYLSRLAWNGSRFVAVGGIDIGTSVDGLNWSFQQTNAQAYTVSWSGTEFLLSGFSPEILSSPDGVTWSVTRSISSNTSAVASDGTTTVLVGINGNIVTNDGPAVP